MLIPEGYLQANLMFSGNGLSGGAQVTWGFKNELEDKTPAVVAAIIQSSWDEHCMSMFTNNLVFDGAFVKFGPNATGPDGFSPSGNVGTDAGTSVPPQVAILVKKLTDSGGRANRGRAYLPPVRATHIDGDGNVDSDFAAGVVSNLNDWQTDIFAEDLTPVLLHGESSPVVTPTPLTHLVCELRVATQRGRVRG